MDMKVYTTKERTQGLLFKCVMPLTSHVHDRGHGYSNSFNSAEVYILTHTIHSPPALIRELEWRNEAHILHQPS